MSEPLSQRLAHAGLDWIVPEWAAPSVVHALSTTRNGGISTGARTSLDIGGALPLQGTDYDDVRENRRRVARFLPAAPVWLTQVHGIDVATIDADNVAALSLAPPTADAAVTRIPGIVIGVRTADCLPVLFANRSGTVIGAAHAGWRGLGAGVLEATVRAMQTPARNIVAWLGPAIGPKKFEVGRDVFDAFRADDPAAVPCFAPLHDGKWLADLYALAKLRLQHAGVTAVSGGGFCTLTDTDRFFSYRANKDTGRMATVAWIA